MKLDLIQPRFEDEIPERRYELYILSNTSPLHTPVFEQMYLEAAGSPVKDFFKKIYYSFEIGWHKPDAEAWEHVISDARIVPQETLFLDDNQIFTFLIIPQQALPRLSAQPLTLSTGVPSHHLPGFQ
jgi:hypothetical protein